MKRYLKVAAVAAAIVVTSGSAAAVATKITNRSTTNAVLPAGARAPRATDLQTDPEGLFVPVTPCRVIDTRHASAGKMRNGHVRNFYIAGTAGFPQQGGRSGGCGIPSTATAVAVAFKVVRPTADGFLHVWPDGESEPTATALSWTKGASLGDSSTVKIVAGPGIDISTRMLKSDADMTADVFGYYGPQIQALIGASGVIDAGSPRVTSVSHAGTGFYYVTLDRPARQCAPTAVTYNYGHYASVGLSSSSTPNVVSVLTWNVNTSGTPVLADESFFLTVTC